MEEDIIENDTARYSAPSYHDTARHPLTIKQTVDLFAELAVPRSKRSVQRFCEHGHLDCVRIKGARGDQFFINRESVERYAEELRQIDAVAAIGDEPRQHRAIARSSAPNSDSASSTPTAAPEHPTIAAAEDDVRLKQLEGDILNLRIDNRAKEQAINFLMGQVSTKDQQLQDLSYRLGAAETRVAHLEAPQQHDDTARQTATEDTAAPIEAIIVPTPNTESQQPTPDPAPQSEPKRSIFGRLFG